MAMRGFFVTGSKSEKSSANGATAADVAGDERPVSTLELLLSLPVADSSKSWSGARSHGPVVERPVDEGPALWKSRRQDVVMSRWLGRRSTKTAELR